MKKGIIAAAVLASMFAVSVAHAAKNAEATATWSATAKKDTSSDLVVTPIGSLSFQYAEGLEMFSTQKGMFDVTIAPDASAQSFELSAYVLASTLNYLGNADQTLNVGVIYNGTKLGDANSPVVLVGTNAAAGPLAALVQGAFGTTRVSAQDEFSFNIESATKGGTDSAFSALEDGLWSGDVKVNFLAKWTD